MARNPSLLSINKDGTASGNGDRHAHGRHERREMVNAFLNSAEYKLRFGNLPQ